MPASCYWIVADVPGRLGVAPRPCGGDWLQDELQALRSEGVNVLVSLLTHSEQRELNLLAEAETCRNCGLEYLAFPIDDLQVPEENAAGIAFAQKVSEHLAMHKKVVVHCRMGIGRSSMMAATVLVLQGLSVEAAFAQIASARGCAVPDTPQQRAWVEKFAVSVSKRASASNSRTGE